PICSFCKNIRNDDGYYEQIEAYIHKHSGVDFSHTVCPTCIKKHYPEEYKMILQENDT
ncbi:MAG: GAF domain-containing protein, partial [Candidatus Electrothrix sp. AR1]|nr:GAF domain-containing protein [Candidatus Electrothrix sp. AR1]